jgi:subtilisin family serine protease
VGILSTVPARHGIEAPFASMGGTSMASPAVCGTLAAILSLHPVYRSLPRDQTRAEMARSILRQSCRDVDLGSDFQGAGVPFLSHPEEAAR